MSGLSGRMRQNPCSPSEIIEFLKNQVILYEEIINNSCIGVGEKTGKCWVDGSEYLYGSPNGKLVEAPLDACKGCHIAGNYTKELEELLGLEEKIKELEQEIREEIIVSLESAQNLLNKLAKAEYSEELQKEIKSIFRKFIEAVSRKLELELEIIA